MITLEKIGAEAAKNLWVKISVKRGRRGPMKVATEWISIDQKLVLEPRFRESGNGKSWNFFGR